MSNDEKKEIIFGIGGGSVCYQLGIAKYIIENYDNNYLKNDFYYGGASAGSITSLIMCSVLHGANTVDKWFNEIVIKIINEISAHDTGILFKMNKIIDKHISSSYEEIIKKTSSIYNDFLNDKYHFMVSEIPFIKKKIINSSCIKNKHDLVNGVSSSCNAPLMTNKIFKIYNNSLCTDGVFCNKVPSRFTESKKIYFSIINQSDNNCHLINLRDWGTLSITDLWLWGNINLCKNLYHQGYTDATKNKNQISRYILNNNINIFYEKLLNQYNKKYINECNNKVNNSKVNNNKVNNNKVNNNKEHDKKII
jgi:hypothetical protein